MSKHLNKIDQTILVYIDFKGRRTKKQISRLFELDKADVHKSLAFLMDLKLIDKTDEQEPEYYSLRED